MLKKSQRLTTEEVTLVITKGLFAQSPFFTMRFIFNKEQKSKFAAITSKKIFKTAVARNAMRRRVYAMIGGLIKANKAPTCASLALICKDKAVGANTDLLKEDIAKLFAKIS